MTGISVRFAILVAACLLSTTGSVATATAQPGITATDRTERTGYCEGPARDASLRADQANLLARLGRLTTLRGPGDLSELSNLGWSVPAHYYASFQGMGVGITRPSTLSDREIRSGYPAMLSYRPINPQPPGDAFAMNFPYELIGWAHSLPYSPGAYPTSPD
ncbi:hypothetical protein ACW9HQ_39510, partial [Nocardia gipuzkoensis]